MNVASPEKTSRTGTLTDRVNTQVLPSQADVTSMHRQASNGPEVLASGEKMNSEITAFANRYGEETSPLDNPKSQAYL